MPKILLIANTSWYLYNFRKSLIITLLNKGYCVICVAPFDDYSEKLKNLGIEFVNIEYDNSNINPIKDLLFLFKLISILKKQKPNVVLSYTIKANIYEGVASLVTKTPFIANVSGLGSLFIKNNFLSKFTLFLYKIGLRKADMVFFQNNDDYRLFTRNNIIKHQHVDVLPGSGVDLNWFSSTILKESSDKIIFLFASRLLKDKGIIECINAIKLLKEKNKNVELQVLGKIWPKNPSSTKQSELDNWINSGLITHIGFTDDIRMYIENADVIILPSYREGMARILLEAASMGKPLITTDVPGCRETVDDGITGFICQPRDTLDLLKKMKMMIELTKEERDLMGKRGRKKMEREFDETIVINKYFDAIKQLCK